jgi:rhodanese-related sulfurtransferase
MLLHFKINGGLTIRQGRQQRDQQKDHLFHKQSISRKGVASLDKALLLSVIRDNMVKEENEEAVMNGKVSLLIIAFLFAACASVNVGGGYKTSDELVKEAKTRIREISVNELHSMIDNKEKIVILDVRDRDEFETGYIPGAINLSRGMLEFKINVMISDRNTKIVVYCGVDLRGPLATRTLNEMGYSDAVNLIGGLRAWKAAGYPIEK